MSRLQHIYIKMHIQSKVHIVMNIHVHRSEDCHKNTLKSCYELRPCDSTMFNSCIQEASLCKSCLIKLPPCGLDFTLTRTGISACILHVLINNEWIIFWYLIFLAWVWVIKCLCVKRMGTMSTFPTSLISIFMLSRPTSIWVVGLLIIFLKSSLETCLSLSLIMSISEIIREIHLTPPTGVNSETVSCKSQYFQRITNKTGWSGLCACDFIK